MDVDRLWAGWRLAYVEGIAAPDQSREECVFCRLPDLPAEESLIVDSGSDAYSVLNLYPYNTGHLLVVPYRHVSELEDLDKNEADDVWRVTRRSILAIKAEYRPDGMNVGANLGRAAGAGLPGHFHMHVLPRWSGDTNFITVIGGTKVMPEEIQETWKRLRARLDSGPDLL